MQIERPINFSLSLRSLVNLLRLTRQTKEALAKSHKRQFVDASSPTYKLGTHYCSNPNKRQFVDTSSPAY